MDQGQEPPSVKLRPWSERSNTLGVLPGKSTEQADALRLVLAQLPIGANQSVEVVSSEGAARSISCETFFVKQLTRGAFVARSPEGSKWIAPAPIKHWLKTADDLYLARHIHANVKYFGELLSHIDDDARTSDLLKLGELYGLHWTSTDQIGRRLNWMQSLGLLERWGFSRIVVTEHGREFLASVDLCTPEEATGQSTDEPPEPVELPEPCALVTRTLEILNPETLRKRKTLVGYIPRGRKGVEKGVPSSQISTLDSVRTFVDLVGDGASTDELFRRASTQLGQKKSSFTTSMHAFRHLGLIDLVSYNRYGPTEEAAILLAPGCEVDFVRFLHARYRFIGELLDNLKETTAVPALAKVAAQSFGCSQIEGSEVRNRLGLMLDAGLVERIDFTRYRATPRGRLLAAELLLETPLSGPSQLGSVGAPDLEAEGPDLLVARSDVGPVFAELRRCSNRSDASADFERSVARAFELFGFRAEHLGGSGRTDVLINVQLAAADKFRSIIDAKSSANGIISDNAIKFDALKDHQKKHQADYVMIVGPDFAPRVKDWARNNKFGLLTVEDLISLLERHCRTPLTLPELRRLFQNADSDLSDVEEQYDHASHAVEVLTRIVDMLYQEANDEDPVADGYISLENLHYILRKDVTPRPSREMVNECLQFLSSSMVKAVSKNGDKYKIVDAPSNIARRLCGLGAGLKILSVDDGGS